MSEVQAVLFDKQFFTTDECRRWLRKHDFAPRKRVHETENYYRYQLTDPRKYRQIVTKKLSNHVLLLIGYLKAR